jgi:hypothetical protein
VGDPVDEGRRRAVAAKRRRRFPHGYHELLQEIVLIGRFREGATDPVEHRKVIPHPAFESLVVWGHSIC